MKLKTLSELQKEKESLITCYKYYDYNQVKEQNINGKLKQLLAEEELLMTIETTETTTTTKNAIEKARGFLEKVFSLSQKIHLYLINDNAVNGYIVIEALKNEVGLSHQEALNVTMDAHYNGESLIVSGKRNKLQEYKDKLLKYYISTEIK